MPGSPEGFRQIVGSRFSPRPGMQLGAVDSAHEVFFGRLGSKDVVVKPHNSEKNARHEEKVLKVALNSGITVIKSLGVYAGKGDAYLVTRHEPRLVSAASLPFAGVRGGPVAETVSDVTQSLATMHGRGISHGDAQIKNFGLIRGGVTPVMVYDLEKGGTDDMGHVKSDPYGHDLESLVQSLAYKGFGGSDMDLAANTVEQFVIDPYLVRTDQLGVDQNASSAVAEGAYGAFLDMHEQLAYAQSNGGHGKKS